MSDSPSFDSDPASDFESSSSSSSSSSPAASASSGSSAELPVAPVRRWLAPVHRFLHIESSSGLVLLACTIAALFLANSVWGEPFAAIWKTKVELSFGSFRIAGDLGHLVINDGLMAIFFFVVGLEIKRELVEGELNEWRKALLPLFAAIGGMVAPALIYLAMQSEEPGRRGWAIPMATDIAFVVGVLALFGSRVPFSLKIMLLSLAIIDDLGAVIIIALVFTDNLSWSWMGWAAAGLAATYAFNRAGVRSVGVYVAWGIVVWFCMLRSGIHPTVAGVALGLLTPSRPWIGDRTLISAVNRLRDKLWMRQGSARTHLEQLKFVAREAVSPLERLETALHPWVAFIIIPLFALANTGVALEASKFSDPVALAIAAGLAVGKPVGILLACALTIRLGIARLPEGVNWTMLAGGSSLAGIGFTMAIFLNGLAFPGAEYPDQETAGKVGILTGSLISAVLGGAALLWGTRSVPAADPKIQRLAGPDLTSSS